MPSLRTILVAGLLCAVSSSAVADGADFFDVIDVRSDDVLFLRESPSPKAKKVGAIPHDGKGIRNKGCVATSNGKVGPNGNVLSGARWCRVSYGSQEGWASARYLREGQGPSDELASSVLAAYLPSVARAIEPNSSMCGTFEARKGFARNTADFKGDGLMDWVIDYGNAKCDGSATMFCGSGGCTLQVLVSTGPGEWAVRFDDTVRSYRVVNKGKVSVLRLELHGSSCRRPGTETCHRDVDFTKSR